MWVFCKAGAGFSVRLLTSCDETNSSACGRSVSLSLSGWVFCEAVLAAVVERVGTFYKKNMVTANQLSASWKGTAATPNREGSGRSVPSLRKGAAPNREGFWGATHVTRICWQKNSGFRVFYFYHSVGGARGAGMHGASRLALPRLPLPRTCFLPAKLGPLRALRWRLSSPQRRLWGLGFRV